MSIFSLFLHDTAICSSCIYSCINTCSYSYSFSFSHS